MDHFTPVDTITTSNFLREVIQSDGSAVLHFLMPVTGLEENGQPVTPPGSTRNMGSMSPSMRRILPATLASAVSSAA
jgi:hypothetical protein